MTPPGAFVGRALVLVAALFVAREAAAAPPLVLGDADAEYLVGGLTDVLADPGGEWQVQEVLARAGQFERSRAARPNFGYAQPVVWLRFSLRNDGPQEAWMLDVAREWIDEATLHQVDGAGAQVVAQWQRASRERPRSLESARPVLPLSLASGETKELLLRIRSHASVAFHGTIVSRPAFEAARERHTIGFGIFYGTLVTLALFNLLLWLSIRASGFLPLGGTLLAYAVGEAGSHGHLTPLGSPEWSSDPRIGAVGLLAAGVGMLLVTRAMLRTRAEAPRADKLLRALMVGCGLAALPVAATPSAHALTFYALGLAVPAILVVAIARAISRDPDAIAFCVAVVAWLGPASVTIAAILGVIPEVPGVENASHVGATVMMVLLSFVVSRQVHRVNLASQRFVPREFLALLGRQRIADVRRGDSVGRVMTVLFADVRGFSTRSEKRTPEENFAWLNRYLETVEPCIRAQHGFVNQYYGDGIVALFESADDAVRASCAMLERLAEVRDLGDGVPVHIGIGIHTGPLMLGTIGGPQRLDTGVVGDAVNTAARIESLTKTYGHPLLISGATEAGLRDRAALRIEKVDRVAPKGKEESIDLFSVARAS